MPRDGSWGTYWRSLDNGADSTGRRRVTWEWILLVGAGGIYDGRGVAAAFPLAVMVYGWVQGL